MGCEQCLGSGAILPRVFICAAIVFAWAEVSLCERV